MPASLPPERSCPCGARTSRYHPLCRKCRARLRWERRAAGADKAAEPRGKRRSKQRRDRATAQPVPLALVVAR
jgi:hypothetical protein